MDKKSIVLTFLLLGIPLVLRAIKGATAGAWAPIVPYPTIRVDSWGDGNYGAARTGHVHRGVDLEVFKGETIYSPIQGTIIRVAYPYANDLKWTGLEIAGAPGSAWDGYRIKMFYMTPTASLIGKTILQGAPIGKAQAISEKYSPEMKNHVHVELWKGTESVDPTPFIIPTA